MLIRLQWPVKKIKRNLESPPKWLEEAFGVQESASGVRVTESNSLAFAAVWASVKILSESVAGLPFNVYRNTTTGKEVDKVHPVYNVVHSEPNQIQTKHTFIQTLMYSVLLYGNGYAIIKKDRFERPKSLEFIHPDDVEVVVKGKIWYKVEGLQNLVPSRNMIHVLGMTNDGIVGIAPIRKHKDSIGLGIASEQYGNKFFKNGSNSTGVFEVPQSLTDEQYKRLKKVLSDRHSGLGNANSPMLLEAGTTYKPITIPPDQAQFLQTRGFQVKEIARIFNIPPHMIGDLERSTNNNIEQQSIEFVQYSLMPWIKRIEEEFTRKLFFESEKGQIFVEVNVEGLLRGDVKARAEFYRIMWNIGAISDNEIRSKENMNPVDGGDGHYVPINMVKVEDAGNNPEGTGQGSDPADQ